VETWVDCWAVEAGCRDPGTDEVVEYMDIRFMCAMMNLSGVAAPRLRNISPTLVYFCFFSQFSSLLILQIPNSIRGGRITNADMANYGSVDSK
jgi:hypothetical protein